MTKVSEQSDGQGQIDSAIDPDQKIYTSNGRKRPSAFYILYRVY